MSEQYTGTRFDMTTPHLRISMEDLPLAWRRVAQDLKTRGFSIAAANMRDIMRSTTPRIYFNHVGTTNVQAGVVA